MSKREKDVPQPAAAPESVAETSRAEKETKVKKEKKPSAESKKLHVEIARGNWKRLESYIDEFNKNPERMAPKMKQADVINKALEAYLQAGAAEKGKR
jgi:hypothetical protein